MRANCPISYHDCSKCSYREEIDDCGYKLCPVCGAHLENWLQMFGEEHRCYETALQEAAREALISIERVGQQVIPPTRYEGIQSILNAALGQWQGKGYRLLSRGKLLILYHEEDTVFVFGEDVTGTLEQVHAACRIDWLRRQNTEGQNAH